MRNFSRIFALCVVAALAMGASNNGARFDDLGHKVMCTCGCGQVLLQCNHLGCPSLAKESAELRADLDRGDGDNAVLIDFQNEYGPTVLAAPMFTKFNAIAWIMPPAVLLLGILGTVILVRRWRRRAAALPPVERDAGFQAMREKIRRETQL
jgi:cytochrome c-type biogenesis protein CcmH